MAMKKRYKIPLIVFGTLAVFYFILVVIRMFHFYNLDKTNEQVVKIHNTKLMMDDVIGKNLPPDPGAEADKTVQGVDFNKNGIRDDVELAIFKKYPDSAKTRAVLLQYALALQMEAVQTVVNEETVGAIAGVEDGAFFCITKIVPGTDKQENMDIIQKYENFVLDKQINTDARKKTRNDFYNKLSSGSIENRGCDIDIDSLD